MEDAAAPVGNQLVSFFQESPPAKAGSLAIEFVPISQRHEYVMQGPIVPGIVYVRHPLDPSELVVFADYDERLAQDRYEEALRVFTSLGAARIVAAVHRQKTSETAGQLSVLGRTFSWGGSKDAGWSLAFNQEGDGGRPVDPRPLRFRDIAGLDMVCDGVLKNGWKKGKIQITRSAALGIDGELAVKIKKVGLNLGVSGSRIMATEFVIEAAFSQEVSKDLDALVASATSDMSVVSSLPARGLPSVRSVVRSKGR